MADAPVVMVTGCSKGGIGYEVCKAFAAAGCKVFATARTVSKMAGLEAVGCTLVQLDVLDAKSCERAVQEVVSAAGRIDVLCNNAGVYTPGPLVEVPISNFQNVMATNVEGPLRLSQLVVPHMAKQGHGTIVNVASGFSYTWVPFHGPYCASKWALRAVSDIMRTELLPLNINLVLVTPGFVRTPMLESGTAQAAAFQSKLGYGPFMAAMIQTGSATDFMARLGASPEAVAKQIATAALRKNPPRYVACGTAVSLAILSLFTPVWFLETLMGYASGMLPRGRAIAKATEARQAAAAKSA